MSSQRAQTTPTKGELEILQVLWKIGPSTVKQVHEKIDRSTGYTTILKLLQIMTEKGLVERNEETRAHVYRANISEKRATGDFISELIERVFHGSRSRLVMQALGAGKTSRAELREIRKLIEEMESQNR